MDRFRVRSSTFQHSHMKPFQVRCPGNSLTDLVHIPVTSNPSRDNPIKDKEGSKSLVRIPVNNAPNRGSLKKDVAESRTLVRINAREMKD